MLKSQLLRMVLLLVTITTLPACCASSPVPSIILETQKEAPCFQEKAKAITADFKPDTVFKNYSASPKQTHYYGGVKATQTPHLTKAAAQALTSDSSIGKTVLSSALARPHYEIVVKDDVDTLVNQMLSTYPDCQAKQRCHTDYTNSTCFQSALADHPTCRKALVLSALPAEEAEQTITLQVKALPHHAWQSKVVVTADLTSGQVLSRDATVTVKIVPLLQIVPCEGLVITPRDSLPQVQMGDAQHAVITVLDPPSCHNHFQVRFALSASGLSKAPLQGSLGYRVEAKLPPQVHESWNSGCTLLEQLQAKGLCQPDKVEVCVGDKATRTINGQPITRDCWTKKSSYTCFNNVKVTNDCSALKAKGCEQIGSSCQTEVDGVCAAYEQTYRCPEQQCVNLPEIVCGEETLCLKGDCGVKPSYAPSQDFEHGVSSLSSTRDASQQFDKATIFKGTPQSCRDEIGDFSDCCSKEGWGQNLHLAHCSQEEKSLALSRQNGMAVEVGRYCAHHLPWPLEHVCTEHKQGYCVFGSKLARILQTQGRAQLHLNFGSGEEPDCSGITPQQLQKMNLAKMDFSDFYADLKGAVQTPDRLQAIRDRIADFQRQGQAHE